MEFVLTLITAFVIALISIKIAKPLARNIDLVDQPDERKHHSGSIPLIGGISIYFGVLAAPLIWMPRSFELDLYMISSALIVMLGVLDDKHDLSVKIRLVGQVLVASIMIFGADRYIESLGDLFGFGDIHLSYAGILLTYIAVVGAINAFNMVDGMDGLIGMLSIVSFSSLTLLFLLNSEPLIWQFPLIIVMAIIPYMIFNLSTPGGKLKKIFMGDAGSMFVGFSIVWLLIIGSQKQQPAFAPVTALWIIAVPAMDMAAIMYRRWAKGQSMFKPDRDHLHHIFMRAGFSPRQSLLIITFFAILFAGIGITGEYSKVPQWLMFAAFLAIFASYCFAIKHIWRVLHYVRMHWTHEEKGGVTGKG